MLTKATRAQILGSATFMLGAWPRGGAPIRVCTADLTGLSGADQECDGGWSVAGEGRVVWSWGTHQFVPAGTLHQLPVGAVWEHCQGLATHLPAGPAPAHPCWPMARQFGEQKAF